jgi:hypothetical protein
MYSTTEHQHLHAAALFWGMTDVFTNFQRNNTKQEVGIMDKVSHFIGGLKGSF